MHKHYTNMHVFAKPNYSIKVPTSPTLTLIKMAPKPTIFYHDDDDDAVTWEHLEDIFTTPTENTSVKDDGESENEPRSYHVENVDVESHRPTQGGSSRTCRSSVIRVRAWYGKARSWGSGGH